MTEQLPSLIKEACKALALDVPYYRAEINGDVLVLYLYGHTQPVTWQHAASQVDPPPPGADPVPRPAGSRKRTAA